MPYLERPGGVKIHWEERGSGPLVVLAPYANAHPSVYDPLEAELTSDHRIVRFDDRGMGQSTRTGPFDMETGAGDLAAVIDEAGGPAVVITLTDAVHRAARVAVRRPDLVDALVAPGGTPAGRARLEGSEAMVASDSVVDAFMSMGETDYRGALRSVMTAANPQMTDDEVRERVKAQIEYQPQETVVARWRAWVDDDATDEGREMGDRLLDPLRRAHERRLVPGRRGGSPDLESPLPRGPCRGGGRRHDQPARSVRKRRAPGHLQGALDRLTDMPNLSRPGDIELHFEERGDGPLVVLAPYWSGQPGVSKHSSRTSRGTTAS